MKARQFVTALWARVRAHQLEAMIIFAIAAGTACYITSNLVESRSLVRVQWSETGLVELRPYDELQERP